MAISIALIILLGLSADALFRRLKLPGLVGMLIVGVLVGPYVFSLVSPEMMKVSGDFRKNGKFFMIGKTKVKIKPTCI